MRSHDLLLLGLRDHRILLVSFLCALT